VADVQLLDELAELLGDTGAANRAAARKHAAEEAERAEALEYAEHVVDSLREAEAIVVPALEVETFVDWIAGRNAEAAPRGSLAEQALADRQWTYGHVIVDEAQELSAMSWRMLIRRCPARSMTIVGDLNQTGAADGADSWAQVLDRVAAGRWRTARLTVNYRTPKPVMELAAGFLPPGAEPPLSVRDSGEAPWYAPDTGDLAGLVWREAELVGDGRVAVITPPGLIARAAAALGVSPGPDLDAPVTVLTPELAKGLEFDSVVVVDPGGIEQASPRGRADLYVALTRTTRRLGLVITGDAPPGLAAAGHQQSAPGAAAAGDG
jgi:superfamily I DNA/RNA helicase